MYIFCGEKREEEKIMSKLNSTLFSDVNRIQRCDNIKFHCEVRGYGTDVHRTFVGAYYPRWRGMYLDEARPILGGVKLFRTFPFDVYTKENGEAFFTADFVEGQSFVLGDPQNERDVAARTFYITFVDLSQLTVFTEGTLRGGTVSSAAPSGGPLADLRSIRDGFVRIAGGVPELAYKALGRYFREVDFNGRRTVGRTALQKCAAAAGVELTAERVNAIFSAMPANAEGCIDYEAIMDVLRGPLSLRRQTAIRDLFRKLDFDNDGFLKLRELAARYNPNNSPFVLDGTLTADQMQRVFMASTWDNTQHAGVVSSAEFIDYYNGVSVAADSDEAFEGTIKATWKLV